MSVEQTPQEKLERLARVLVESVGVQTGDYVLLHYFTDANKLATLTEAAAYDAGAATVALASFDPSTLKAQLQTEKDCSRFTFDTAETALWQEVMDKNGCVIQIRTDFNPQEYEGLNNEFGRWYKERWQARADFFERGVMAGEFAWTLIYVPNQHSAERIYPELPAEQALFAYWDDTFTMTLTDTEGARVRARENDATLLRRTQKLDALNLASVHFAGDGTDLTVGLTQRSRWCGGSKQTHHPEPRTHILNVPSYEVYTTPDWRTLTGTVTLTKAVAIDGARIVGGQLWFEAGEVVKTSATEGAAVLAALVERDAGAKRVGELALVGLDSPVAQTGRVFESLLFDENAACHIALGNAYLAPIIDGADLSEEVRTQLGINTSCIHHDVMISDKTTTVTGTTHDGREVCLIKNGHWTADFR